MFEEGSFTHTSIFDLDHTLCSVNTSFRFGLYLLSIRYLPLYKMPYLMGCYFFHKIGLLSLTSLHEQACSHFFQGKPPKILKDHVRNFLDRDLKQMLNPSIYQRLIEAKNRGDYTVLLSSSPDFLVGEIAKRMEFHAWAGTEYHLTSNPATRVLGRTMEGDNKADYVLDLMKKLNIHKKNTTAYSDSFLDLPVLEVVGNPVAVNPDKILRRVSTQRNWVIL